MKNVLLVLALLSFQTVQAADKELANLEVQDQLATATQKAGHGMIVFGSSHVYMYHLPMWESPHAWHLILEVELDSKGLALYQADQAAGGKLQSFNPKSFALNSLKPGSSVSGVLYHGHFEQGGTALPKGSAPATITATVKRILTVKALDPDAMARQSAVYRVFGADGEYFAAHLPVHSPDFDQVLSVIPGEDCSIPDQAATGMTVKFEGVGNSVQERPRPARDITAVTSSGSSFCMLIKAEPYFSIRDLGN